MSNRSISNGVRDCTHGPIMNSMSGSKPIMARIDYKPVQNNPLHHLECPCLDCEMERIAFPPEVTR